MPNSRPRSHAGQLALVLPSAPQIGSYDCGAELARLASDAIRHSGKSRERVAVEMSDLLGTRVTVAQLNAWTAEGKPAHRFPAEYLGAFAFVTGDVRALELLVKQAGAHLVGRGEMARLEVQSIDEQMRELRARKRELQAGVLGEGR